jgi:protocatechuate 3,4-dioxygenase beta subunit
MVEVMHDGPERRHHHQSLTGDLYEQGLRFDLHTMIHRRRMLGLLGGAGLMALFGCSGDDSGDAAAGDASTTTGGATPGSVPGAASTTTSTTTGPAAAPSTGAGTAATNATTATSATPTPSTSPSVAAAATPSSCEPFPVETGGPFPGDGSNGPDALTASGVVRSDIRRSFGGPSALAEGVNISYRLRVLDGADGCKPLVGAAIYLWQCDAAGRYSMYSAGAAEENYLRGVQACDTTGYASFLAVFPGAYPGRWPHAHFEVFPSLADAAGASNKLLTSQLALPAAQCEAVHAAGGAYAGSAAALGRMSLESDNVFRDGATLQTVAITGSPSAGYTALLDITV